MTEDLGLVGAKPTENPFPLLDLADLSPIFEGLERNCVLWHCTVVGV